MLQDIQNWMFHNCIYLVTCGICDVQYIGKTSQTMRKRHGLHRSHIKANRYGLGSHFFKHSEDIGIDMDSNMEDIMQHFKLPLLINTLQWNGKIWKQV